MNPLKLLRYKLATSFAFAALGLIAFVRLAIAVPFSSETLLPFLVVTIFVIAGLWRGCIYLQALRGSEKS